MSASPPKADIGRTVPEVRFVPQAVIWRLNRDRLVGQFVRIDRAQRQRKVLGEDRAALVDRRNEAAGGRAVLHRHNERGDRIFPHLLRDPGVDAAVRADLHVAPGARCWWWRCRISRPASLRPF